jgi:hypothetical protein
LCFPNTFSLSIFSALPALGFICLTPPKPLIAA